MVSWMVFHNTITMCFNLTVAEEDGLWVSLLHFVQINTVRSTSLGLDANAYMWCLSKSIVHMDRYYSRILKSVLFATQRFSVFVSSSRPDVVMDVSQTRRDAKKKKTTGNECKWFRCKVKYYCSLLSAPPTMQLLQPPASGKVVTHASASTVQIKRDTVSAKTLSFLHHNTHSSWVTARSYHFTNSLVCSCSTSPPVGQ